jgi:hypothetical protein
MSDFLFSTYTPRELPTVQSIKKYCSSKLKFHLQGILLTPYNSTIPFFDINKEAKTGFIILPVQYSHRAELYSYISKTNTQADLTSKNQYVNQKITESGSFLIEELLAKRALDQRKQDDYYSQNFFLSKDRQNSYILVSAKFSVRHFDKTPKSLALKVFQRL